MSLNLLPLLQSGLEDLRPQGVQQLSENQCHDLLNLISLLAKWGKTYNLSAVRDPEQMISRHLLESVLLSQWLPHAPTTIADHVDVLDIGSGAGFPGLPLAILRPDLSFVSVEPVGKKIRFQQQVLIELGLSNVTLVDRRIQETHHVAQWVVSRAFTAPLEFLNVALPHCASGGTVITLLGIAEKFPSPVPAGYQLLDMIKVDIPGTKSHRHVAICRRE